MTFTKKNTAPAERAGKDGLQQPISKIIAFQITKSNDFLN